MIITDEKLSAYIDGELSASETEVIDRALETDDALAARLNDLKNPDRLMSAVFGDIDNEPMFASVTELLERDAGRGHSDEAGGKVIRFPFERYARTAQRWAAPLAASVALAIGVGVGMQLAPSNGGVKGESVLLAGAIDQSSPIHEALGNVPSGQTLTAGAASITPVLTFQSTDGEYCREFKVQSDAAATRALACRKDNLWETQFAAASAPHAADPSIYSTATAKAESYFDEFVQDLIADAPLLPEEEQALLEEW